VRIYPAIDLRGGQCVRLRQGDYTQETVFDADPVTVARRWVEQGAQYLHLVDLDGARQGQPVNGQSVQRIVAGIPGVPCQLGGGMRKQEHIEQALSEWGVSRVILGTRALQDPGWCASVCRQFPGQIAIGIDARRGVAMTEGWLHESDVLALDLAKLCSAWPIAAIIYTDISKDGMLEGPNVEATAELARAVPGGVTVIASGGVTSLDDVVRLSRAGLSGCIIGRALYEGRIDLAEAIKAASPNGQ